MQGVFAKALTRLSFFKLPENQQNLGLDESCKLDPGAGQAVLHQLKVFAESYRAVESAQGRRRRYGGKFGGGDEGVFA